MSLIDRTVKHSALPARLPTGRVDRLRTEALASLSRANAPSGITRDAAATLVRRRWLIVVAAMIGAVLEVLDTSITNVAVPQMMGNLGATLSEIGWVSTGYIISNVIVLPMTGWLADRLSRRLYFAVSIGVFTVSSLLCGLSHSLDALVFWRVIQGLGGGGLLATGQVIMLHAFPKENHGVATAIFGMGVMVGPSLGPVLGGFLTDNFSWPWIFYINVPFGIAGIILTLLYVPAEKTEQSKIDFVGMGLLAAGMGSLQTVLERGQEEDWFSSNLIGILTIISIVSLLTFVWWELHVSHPVVDLRVFKDRSLAAGSVFNALVGVALYATLFLLPVYLQTSQGYTAFETGMIMLPAALVSMLSFMVAGPLAQRVDPRKLLAVGIVFMVTGSFGLSHMTTQSGQPDLFVPLILRGASLGFLFIPLALASLAGLKADQIGVGSGVTNLMRQLGGSVGIAAISTVMSRRLDQHMDNVADHINVSNTSAGGWLAGAEHSFVRWGMSPQSAHMAALKQLGLAVRHQAMMLSFDDSFLLIASAFVVTMPLLLMFRKGMASIDLGPAH